MNEYTLNSRYVRKHAQKVRQEVMRKETYKMYDETCEDRLAILKAQTMNGTLPDNSITPYCSTCGEVVKNTNNYACEWFFKKNAICKKCHKS